MNPEKPFLNFQVDHMTLLLQPEFYTVAYFVFHVVFGVRPEDIVYTLPSEKPKDEETKSMTYALKLGEGANPNPLLNVTQIAVVQPTEPEAAKSHVRVMLNGGAAHWQHIALRTPDLFAFHDHAKERGVQFVTRIIEDADQKLIQVFSGEWYFPGTKPSGLFFEFVQRNPTDQDLAKLEMFRDEAFLGLYNKKQEEYDSKNVMPFISFELFDLLLNKFKDKQIWDITKSDIADAETLMIEHTRNALGS